jgi:hypothetical protein
MNSRTIKPVSRETKRTISRDVSRSGLTTPVKPPIFGQRSAKKQRQEPILSGAPEGKRLIPSPDSASKAKTVPDTVFLMASIV